MSRSQAEGRKPYFTISGYCVTGYEIQGNLYFQAAITTGALFDSEFTLFGPLL
jgi:hypothetical protein